MTAQTKNNTNWRAVWRLIKPFWSSEQKWKAWGLLTVIIALVLGMVYINVRITNWNRDLYDSLEQKNFPVFKALLWQFTYLAFTYIVVAIYRSYLVQSLQFRWRAWMTDKYMATWLANQAYYRMEQGHIADNPDQRIAEDLRALTFNALSLVLGFISSAVTLVSFVGILWTVSGPVAFALLGKQWTIPGYMVWFAIAYAFVGSWIIWWIGKPLVKQNFDQERFEANYRFGLIRVREHAEGIAFYRGEAQERRQLGACFEDIRRNWWDIMHTTKRLNIAVNFYGQFSIIFPLLVSSPRYFAGVISLGVVMQIASAFGQVQDALSWFINAFTTLADWKASINRLAGFNQAVEQAQRQPSDIVVERDNVSAMQIEKLDLALPDGKVLTSGLSGAINPGQRVLVSGPSGCGKSTLFRAIAGIWPYGSGAIRIPQDSKLMFVPQLSYLPIGTLRAAVAYPSDEKAYTDEAIGHYLDLCRLPHLKDSLDTAANWSKRLSPGEQQRLAFVRVLLSRPDAVFLDEASSAMDGETEDVLYSLLLQELPDAAVISIAHRETVARYHQERWHFSRAPAPAANEQHPAAFVLSTQSL